MKPHDLTDEELDHPCWPEPCWVDENGEALPEEDPDVPS